MCKKLVSVLLCGLLVLTFFTPASAGLIQDQSGVRQYPILVDQGENYQVVSIPLTEKEAEKRYWELTGKELPDALRGNYNTAEVYYREEIGPGWIVEIGCIVNTACGQSCSFIDVVEGTEYVAADGDGFWEINPQYVNISVAGSRKIKFQTRFQIEVETTQDLSAEFEALGFSIGASTSGTYYARKLMSISKTETF